MKIKFNSKYFGYFCLVFVTEVAIAIFYFHRFIRGFVGDVLVIPLLFTFLKTFFNWNLKKTLLGIVLFAFAIEFLQYFKLLDLLEVKNIIIRTVLGTAFELTDLLAYILGAILVYIIEIKKGSDE